MERPILFSAPMVRAILDGRKSQTRRVIKPVQSRDDGMWPAGRNPASDCPYGRPSDQLWVREMWAETDRPDGTPVVTYAAGGCIAVGRGPQRRTDDFLCHGIAWSDTPTPDRWRPSIHMPRWASRITLEITDVRVQRVQDIGEEDARAEGVLWVPGHGEIEPADLEEGYSNYLNCREGFQVLWDSINAKRGFGWDINPWIWALTFKRVEG